MGPTSGVTVTTSTPGLAASLPSLWIPSVIASVVLPFITKIRMVMTFSLNLSACPCRRSGVHIDGHLRSEDHAEVAPRCPASDEAVEHVVEHPLWVTCERMAVPAASRTNTHEPVAGPDLGMWHLGWQ